MIPSTAHTIRKRSSAPRSATTRSRQPTRKWSVKSGKAHSQDGSFIWYGLERGADMSAYAGTGGSPLKGKPFSIALEYWVYYLAQDSKWDWSTLTHAGFEQLWKKSVEQYGAAIGTDDPDLTRFR